MPHTPSPPTGRLVTSMGSLMLTPRRDGTVVAHTVSESAHFDGIDSRLRHGALSLQVSVHLGVTGGHVELIDASVKDGVRNVPDDMQSAVGRLVAEAYKEALAQG